MEQGKWVRIAGKGQEMEQNKEEMKKMHRMSLGLDWSVDGKVVVVTKPQIELMTAAGDKDFLFPGQKSSPQKGDSEGVMESILQGKIPQTLTEAPDIINVRKAELSAEEVKLRQALYGSADRLSDQGTGSKMTPKAKVAGSTPQRSLPSFSRAGSSLMPGSGSPNKFDPLQRK